MICKNCGKELSEGARFCSSCGTPCEGTVPQTTVPKTDAAEEGAKAVSDTVISTAETPKAEDTAEASEAVTPTLEAPKTAEGTEVSEVAAPAAEAPKAEGTTDATVAVILAAEAPKAEGEGTTDAAGAVILAAEAPKAEEAPGAAANGDKPQTVKSDEGKKLIFMVCGETLLVLMILLCCGAIFGSSPKKAFKAYISGNYTCDYKKVLNNSISSKKAQKALDVYDKDDYEDYCEDLRDFYEDRKDDWKDDNIRYKVSTDIKDVEMIKKGDREFKWAKEFMEDYFDCDADKIKQFAIVEARVKAIYYEDGDRDKKNDVDTGRTQFLMIKIGSDWYYTGYSDDEIKDNLKYYK